jgi:hypothetical protein
MIKKLIIATILIVLLCTMADAKMPQKGDSVRILVGFGLGAITYDGTITDIGNDLICLNSTHASMGDTTLWRDPRNACVGAGSITTLIWLDKDGEPI